MFGSRNKKVPRDRLLIVGPVSSGKTSLYYRLLSGEHRETVSSIDLNKTKDSVKIRISGSGPSTEQTSEQEPSYEEHAVAITDIPGHYNFRSEITQSLNSAKAIITVLDSKDKTKYGEAAEILYDILGNIDIISDEVPVLVACNKQDLSFAKNASKMEKDLMTEIE